MSSVSSSAVHGASSRSSGASTSLQRFATCSSLRPGMSKAIFSVIWRAAHQVSSTAALCWGRLFEALRPPRPSSGLSSGSGRGYGTTFCDSPVVSREWAIKRAWAQIHTLFDRPPPTYWLIAGHAESGPVLLPYMSTASLNASSSRSAQVRRGGAAFASAVESSTSLPKPDVDARAFCFRVSGMDNVKMQEMKVRNGIEMHKNGPSNA